MSSMHDKRETIGLRHADALRSTLETACLYDSHDSESRSESLSDLLADIMHLIDADPTASFDALCLRALRHYEAERLKPLNANVPTKEAV